ncbi:biotin-dependent carboxyltransferase family protein [Gracilimonas sp.]|uniref:5-oxoprolinase subunit C family protein n=1 Tax=Gracilimonas sp. TaxID=1974203 RepID=UPI0032EFFB70
MKNSLEVIDGGLLTTIQDNGRFGYRQYGVPVSGAMDDYACRLANWLVGNPEGSPVLEMTLKGGTYQFNSNSIIAITGAYMKPKVNDKKVEMNVSVEVKAGDVLSLGYCKRGCRSYLAIRGQLDIQKVLGSYSTYLTGNFGGFEGRKLAQGDELFWDEITEDFSLKEVPKDKLPYYSSKVTLRILEGPEWDWLTKKQQSQLLNAEYQVSSKSNRMGVRLSGQNIKSEKVQMTSAPVIPGIIQLPESGNPIIIMKDGQAVGGYPRIAKVADADLWRVGQFWGEMKINFNKINREEAGKLSSLNRALFV